MIMQETMSSWVRDRRDQHLRSLDVLRIDHILSSNKHKHLRGMDNIPTLREHILPCMFILGMIRRVHRIVTRRSQLRYGVDCVLEVVKYNLSSINKDFVSELTFSRWTGYIA